METFNLDLNSTPSSVDTSLASASFFPSTSDGHSNNYEYDVFINHHDDVKETLASHLYHSLISHGLRVLLDIEEMQQGDGLNSQIERAIETAFVHIAIFSPGYAESKWCLDELVLMLHSGKTIIPAFYGVHPSELRSENGKYAQDLENKRTFDSRTCQINPRYDCETIGKWRNALSQVADINGFVLKDCNGDEGKMVNNIVERVLKKLKNHRYYDVFINHRGPDVRKTLASHLYYSLTAHGLRVFLDIQEMQEGDGLNSQIERAIETASVHIAIFSPRYAESKWCLDELVLMLHSGKTIIPVFGVHPVELRSNHGEYARNLTIMEKKRTFDCRRRYDCETIGKWRNALSQVADINGFVLENCNGEEGKMVNNIVERVLKKLKNHRYYDVFINHRGPDVKKTLASHLYYSLTAHGLRVFLDIEEMQQGDGLNSQIERAIETAFVHIAIFSPGYAESKWCLDELVLMLHSGKTIIPAFYGVHPSELRSENGKYAQDLCKLKDKKALDTETVEKWRSSLSHVAKVAESSGFDFEECDGDEGKVISGFDLEKCDGDEGQLVDQVVKQVLIEEVKIFGNRAM